MNKTSANITMVGVRDPKEHKKLLRKVTGLESKWQTADPDKQLQIDEKLDAAKRELAKVEVPLRNQDKYHRLLNSSEYAEPISGELGPLSAESDSPRYGTLDPDSALSRLADIESGHERALSEGAKKKFELRKGFFDIMTGGKGKVDLKAKAEHESKMRSHEENLAASKDLMSEAERLRKHPGVQSVAFKYAQKSLGELEESSRRRQSAAAGLATGLGLSGYVAGRAHQALEGPLNKMLNKEMDKRYANQMNILWEHDPEAAQQLQRRVNRQMQSFYEKAQMKNIFKHIARNAPKILGLSALAGGAFYAGSRLAGPSRSDAT